MKNVNWFLKILSVTLVFALCFTMFASVPVSAGNIRVQADDLLLLGDLSPEELKTAELDTEDIPEILRDEEIEEKDHVNRLYEQEDSLNSVVFQNRDGTKTKYLYNTPVKYVDDKGEIQDKSNAIYTTLFGNYETRKNDITSYFPKKINQNKGVEINFKGYTVEMSPDIKGNSGASRQTGHNKYGDPTDYVQYTDVFDEGIAVRYTPTFDGLKEDIILEEYTGINEFTFILRTDGLKLFLDENSIPKLSDPETDEVLIDLGALYIYDSAEKELFGDWNHKYILKTIEENEEYKLTVSVDEDYLADPDRVYPVYVDPTIEVDGQGMYKTIMDAPVYDGMPDTNYGTYQFGILGYDPSVGTGRLLMKFMGLETDSTYSSLIPQQVTSLELNFFEGSGTTNSVDLDAYFYLGDDWNEYSVTKNNMSWEGFLSRISTASVSDSDWYSFDLMPAVSLWKSNTDDIYKGIIIKNASGEAHIPFAKHFCTTEHPRVDLNKDGYKETSYNPYLNYTYIPYIPVNGIDITHTELSMAVGETVTIFATVTPTNAFNQNVTFTSHDTSVATVNPSSGLVTGISAGTVIITATTQEGNFSAHCTVKVVNTVTIEKDGNYSKVIFDDGRIWKCAYYTPIQDSMSVEPIETDRAQHNRSINFSIEELGLLFRIDPNGVIYYVENKQLGAGSGQIDYLIYRDNIFREIYGRAPRFFTYVGEQLCYCTGVTEENRVDVYSEAEIIFGFFPRWSFDIITDLVYELFFAYFDDLSGDMVNISFIKNLFFTGAIDGAVNSAAEIFITDVVGMPISGTLEWAFTIVNLVPSILESTLPPDIGELQIGIYENAYQNDHYVIRVSDGNQTVDLNDFIEHYSDLLIQ